jgi:hypothetical protein
MSQPLPPHQVPRPGTGQDLPGRAGDCAGLRAQLLTLQNELRQDVAHLAQLRNSHAPAAQVQEWQQVVSLKSDEVQSARNDMEAAGCFQTPPHPPPPVVFAELGPARIVDADGKITGTGAVVDVAVQPGSSHVIAAATAGGGVWRTTDGASPNPSWDATTDSMPSTATGAVAFAPADSTGRTLFAGTGSFASWPPTGPAVGIYKSADGGHTWRVTGTVLRGRRVRTILPLAAPNDRIVLAAARTWTASGGIFRSTDGGETFGPVRNRNPRLRLPAGDGFALIEDPASPGRVYCAVGGAAAGIFRSDDAGQAWTRVTAGISATDLAAPAWIRLAAGPPVPKLGGSHLFAGVVGSAGQLTGLYAAVSGRDAWTSIPLPPGGGSAVHPNSMGSTKFAIAAPPNRHWLFVAGEVSGVWRADVSDPAAPAWTLLTAAADAGSNVPAGDPHRDCQALVFDAAGNLIVANDGGIYRATGPGGQQPAWQHIGRSMHVTEPLGVSYDTLSAIAISGSSDNGVEYQTAPGSLTWRQLAGEDGGDCDVDNTAADHSWRYYMNFPGGTAATSFTIYRAQFDAANNQLDSGGKLALAAPGSPGMPLTGIAMADRTVNAVFVTNAVAAGQLLLAATNVYETTDGGATATTLLTRPAGLPGVARMAYGGRQDGSERPDVVYCAIGNQAWCRQPGQNLSALPAYQAAGVAMDISVDVYDWRRAVIIEGSRVWRTGQAGQTWTECTGNLASLATDPLGAVNFHNVVVVRASATSLREVVLVGAYTGLFRTVTAADGAAATWEKIGNLPNAVVQSMQYRPPRATHPGGDVLVVGLQGRGTWVLTGASLHL